jgi:phosphomannomutase
LIVSVSGIRGIFNQDLLLTDVVRFSGNFASLTQSKTFLMARDTRRTGDMISKTVASALLAAGARVVDFGIVSTPALFRESRKQKVPALMITASHNEPEWNGLKFIVNGRGVDLDQLTSVVMDSKTTGQATLGGRISRHRRQSYDDDLIQKFGEGSFGGVKVALDPGGGAALVHAPGILRALGCKVTTINDTPGVFDRTIDPVADDLSLLQRVVKADRCDIGLAFDCDGDRLVIIDSEGKKRSGDFMLTMALDEILRTTTDRSVVVSVDTTQAVDELVRSVKGKVYRSKVGEANVVQTMLDTGAQFGGEGSSGGLIDGSFNFCRDSMLAALTIIRSIKTNGIKAFRETKNYSQTRLALPLIRARAVRAIKEIQKTQRNVETIDGVKVRLSPKSWVLIRPSGTEDVVRVSAEAPTAKESKRIAENFLRKLKELSR